MADGTLADDLVVKALNKTSEEVESLLGRPDKIISIPKLEGQKKDKLGFYIYSPFVLAFDEMGIVFSVLKQKSKPSGNGEKSSSCQVLAFRAFLSQIAKRG